MKRPTITLCVIARDEARLLPGCLDSVRGVADQIIVVDTGSADGTADLARAAGAEVVPHLWQDDFSAARNAALPLASGDWILVLDADERLHPGARDAVLQAVRVGNFHLGVLPVHSASSVGASHDDVISGAARLGDPVLLPRLLRRTEDLRWEGLIYENVDVWFSRGEGRRAVRIAADIVHLGRARDGADRSDKTAHKLALLERACALAPAEPTRRAWLARQLLSSGQRQRARAEAETAWRCCLDRGSPVVLPATLAAYLRLGDGDIDGAQVILRQALAAGGRHPNIDLLFALALLQDAPTPAELDEAEAALTRCRSQEGTLYTAELIPGATTWAALTQQGVLALLRSRPAEALAHFSEALTAHPDHSAARLGAGEALLELGRAETALAVLEPALADGGADGWILAAEAALSLRQYEDARALLSRSHTAAAPSTARRARRQARVEAALDGRILLAELTDGASLPPKGAAEEPTELLLADGEARFAQGDLDGAVDRFVRALTLEPGSADGWADLGVGLHAAGLLEGAVRALRMAVRNDPGHREAWMSLGNIAVELGRPDEAAESFRRLLDHHPGDPIALESLQIMGLQGATAADPTPLLTVLLGSTGERIVLEDALDRLALQELHPALFEVIVRTDLSEATAPPRPYTLRALPPDTLTEDAADEARGRWLVVLEPGDRPSRDLLRRHLAAQVTTETPSAFLGARGFAESRRDEPLVDALLTLRHPGAPLSNLSLPTDRLDALTVLRWRPEQADLPLHRRPEIRCWREEDVTLSSLQRAHLDIGADNRRAWEIDPSTPIPDLPGPAGEEESWLGARMALEGSAAQADQDARRIEHALQRGEAVEPAALARLLRQARRLGLVEGALPPPPQVLGPPLRSSLTSIVMLCQDDMPHLRGSIRSLRQSAPGPVELIVVDLGSRDGSRAWLRRQPDLHLIEVAAGTTEAAARNRGLAATRGETVLFCDGDVRFPRQWRSTLLRHLDRWPDIGMVGPGTEPGAPGAHAYTRHLPLSFALLRREVLDTIGGLDEDCSRWGFGSEDLCVRVGLAGYRLRQARDLTLEHLSSDRSDDSDAARRAGWAAFKTRWGLDPELPLGLHDPDQILSRASGDRMQLYVPFRPDDQPPPADPIRLIHMR